MRPPVITGGIRREQRQRARLGEHDASMRPPVITGGIRGAERCGARDIEVAAASMRPPVITGGISLPGCIAFQRSRLASMRPPVITGGIDRYLATIGDEGKQLQ